MFIRKFRLMNQVDDGAAGAGNTNLYNDPGTGGNPPPSNPPPSEKITWDSDKWKDLLDDDIKTDPSLTAIKDPKMLAKSYVETKRMVGADKILLPNKNSTEADWDQIFTKLGKPDAPDKYELKFEDGVPVSDDFTKNLKESMFKAGLNQNQAAKVAEFWQNQVKSSHAQIEASENARIAQETQALRQEWGPAYEGKIKAAKVAWETFGGKDIFEHLQENGLHTDTRLAKIMAKVGEALVEDGIVNDIHKDSLLTPMDADKELGEIMANPKYWDASHPEQPYLVKRAEELHKIKAAGKK